MSRLNGAVAAILLQLTAMALVAGAATAQDRADPEDMVDALNGLFGSHKGYRAVHAKGFCGAGSLTATPEAAAYTKASLFDGHAVPTMFRFSLAPAAPDVSDLEQHPRSLVARLELAAVDATGSKGPCDEVMFDPTSVPDGIETSNDPVLLIRPAAYAVSFPRRIEP